jgi:phage tail-like protein
MSTQIRFRVNPHRIDPYKRHLFRLKWEVDGEWITVLGVSRVSGLKKSTEVVNHRSGGENSRDHKAPGRTFYGPIILERGITTDPEFEKWANQVLNLEDTDKDLVKFRRNMLLEILNEKLKPVIRYRLYGCWVSEYNLTDFDTRENGIAIESIKIELEGWDRDTELVEEAE